MRFFYFSSQEVISGLPDTDKFTLLSSRSHLTERTKHGCALLLSSPSEHVSALDLVAVLASGELVVVGLVFAGNESSGKPMQGKIIIDLYNFSIY